MLVAAWVHRRMHLGPVLSSAHCLSIEAMILASAYAVRLWISTSVSPLLDGMMVGLYETWRRGKNLWRSSGEAGEG